MKWTAISLRLLLPVAAVAVTVCGASMPCRAEAAAADAKAPAVTPPPAPAAAPAPAAQPTGTPSDAGMRAYIDPETGLITSQPPPGQQLEPSEIKQEPVLHEEILPDGSVMVDLQGTLQDYMVLQLDANGHLVMRCVEDPKAALETPPPAPQREDR